MSFLELCNTILQVNMKADLVIRESTVPKNII